MKLLKHSLRILTLCNQSSCIANRMLVKQQRILLITVAIISSMMFLSACKKHTTESKLDNKIKVGLFASLTGAKASFGQEAKKGIELAVQEINAQGGILGRPIQLIIKDNQSKAGETSIIVRGFIEREKVDALLGEVASGRSLEAAPIAQHHGVPMISSGSTNRRVTELGNFIFRTCFIDDFQGKAIAKFMHSMGIRRVAVLWDSSTDYSKGLTDNFIAEFTKRGGQIAVQRNYNEGDKDFAAQLTAIQAVHPEAVFLPCYYTEAPLIIKQARKIGLEVPFMGGDGWDSAEFLKLGGKDVEGTYFSTHFSSDNQSPLVQDFVTHYYQKYNEIAPAMAALAYDSMKLLANAMQRAGSTDKTKVRDALQSTKDFPAVTGAITFDENRNPIKPAVIIRVQNGKFTFLENLTL